MLYYNQSKNTEQYIRNTKKRVGPRVRTKTRHKKAGHAGGENLYHQNQAQILTEYPFFDGHQNRCPFCR